MKHYFSKHEFLVRTAQGVQTHLYCGGCVLATMSDTQKFPTFFFT